MIPTLSIPEIRDYQKINAELVGLLDQGHPTVILQGAERQRLLAFGLRGAWNALVVIEGLCGPEVAAEVDAPGLTILCLGSVGDGAGRNLRSGLVWIQGNAGDAAGIGQSGGRIVVEGDVGHRAGLRQSGGETHLLSQVGRLAGERRSGGRLILDPALAGPHLDHGSLAGPAIPLEPQARQALISSRPSIPPVHEARS